jgi:hypothetical protein
MNPEFRRNIWLELSTRRIMTMTAVLVLIFFAAALSGSDWTPPATAIFLYYFIVVVWGARNAALSVVGEIRDRTWDFQRLSSLGAGEMTWGKLFGSTIFNWYGGALCLVVILAYRLVHEGPLAALLGLIYFIVIGLIAQSVALLASLLAAMRRQTHTRLEVFTYQMAGLIAALVAYDVWQMADPAGTLVSHAKPTEIIPWWGLQMNARAFLLLSLAIFAGWTLLGCYRAMRLELKMQNGPYVWLAFLAFMGVYVAGFDAWMPRTAVTYAGDFAALRLMLAAMTYAIITYVMVLLEPKDRVLYRWLGAEFSQGRILNAARGLQGWMMSYKAFFLVTVVLIGWLLHYQSEPPTPLIGGQALSAAAFVAAAAGFLTRDMAIFILLQTLPGRRRGDFAALVALFALYVLMPSIADGLGLKPALVLFYPQVSMPLWLSPAVAWAEALLIAGLAIGRIAMGVKREAAVAAA